MWGWGASMSTIAEWLTRHLAGNYGRDCQASRLLDIWYKNVKDGRLSVRQHPAYIHHMSDSVPASRCVSQLSPHVAHHCC